MAQIKVTNNSARLFTNVGGGNLIPGQSVTIDAKHKIDLMIGEEAIEGLEIEDVQEEVKEEVKEAAKKTTGWQQNKA